MNINYILNFAKEIIEIDSPSGYTKYVIEKIKQEAEKYNVEYTQTKKGNLILTIPGETDYTIGLSAHVDTLGAMVRNINGNGTLSFVRVGGPILPTLDAEYCRIITRFGKVYTGTFLSTSPAVHVFSDASTKPRTEDTMCIRIDEVVNNAKDVENLGIENGDYIAIDPKVVITESGYFKSRFIDDKMSVAILFGLIKYLKEHNVTLKNTLKFIISTYEEVGHGSSYIPTVDEMIAVDMGCVGNGLKCTEQMVSICCKDSSGPYDYELTTELVKIAKENNINYATDIYPYYSSDVSAARSGGNDFKGALIGPGVHASHGMERTHKDGIENTLKLLIKYLTK